MWCNFEGNGNLKCSEISRKYINEITHSLSYAFGHAVCLMILVLYMQQEGVPSHLLPAVVQAQKEAAAEEAAKKKEKVQNTKHVHIGSGTLDHRG